MNSDWTCRQKGKKTSAYIQSITTKWYPIITSLSNDLYSYINTFTINNINCFIYAERGTLYIALIISWLVIIQVYWKWFCHACELSVSCLTQMKEKKKNGKVLYTIIPSFFCFIKSPFLKPLFSNRCTCGSKQKLCRKRKTEGRSKITNYVSENWF